MMPLNSLKFTTRIITTLNENDPNGDFEQYWIRLSLNERSKVLGDLVDELEIYRGLEIELYENRETQPRLGIKE